jgi:hypothetical protein
LSRRFQGHALSGKRAQLVIHERQQLTGCMRVSRQSPDSIALRMAVSSLMGSRISACLMKSKAVGFKPERWNGRKTRSTTGGGPRLSGTDAISVN